MKVLHVIGRLSRHDGGPPLAVRGMAEALAARGHDVWIYTTDLVGGDETPPPTDRDVPLGAARIRYFPAARPHRWDRSAAMGQALAAIIPSCDLVVIHALYLYHSWLVPRLCRRHDVPYVIRPLGSLDPYIWRRRRWLKRLFEWWHQDRDLRDAAALHYTSAEEQTLAAPCVHGAPGFVVPLGIHPQDFPPSAGPRDGTLLYLGRLHPKKGIELLLDAVATLAPEHPELRLLIAGSGDPAYTASLQARAASPALRGRVDFRGFVAGAAKQAVLAEASLFVLPSYSENFGIAVIEAMAAGLPVIVSTDVNLHAAVSAAGAGWVCAANATALTATLRGALADQASWVARGAAGRAQVLAHYDWAVIGATLETAYHRVIAAAAR